MRNFNSFDTSLIIKELGFNCRLQRSKSNDARDFVPENERKKVQRWKKVENALAIKRDVNEQRLVWCTMFFFVRISVKTCTRQKENLKQLNKSFSLPKVKAN